MTVAEFRVRAPEFKGHSDARVQAALDAATDDTDADVITGVDTENAIFFLAAHLLCSSPTGVDARLKGEGFRSVYLTERERIEAKHAGCLGLTL